MHVSSGAWIAIGAFVVVIGGVLLLRRKTPENLGAVSDQWVAEHRAVRPDDSGF